MAAQGPIDLVTGGASFIGSHWVDALLARGRRVRVIDNYSTGRPENLGHHASDPRLELIQGDINNAGAPRAILAAADSDRVGRLYNVVADNPININRLDDLLRPAPSAHIAKRPGEADVTHEIRAASGRNWVGRRKTVSKPARGPCATTLTIGVKRRYGLSRKLRTPPPTGSSISAGRQRDEFGCHDRYDFA